MATIPVRLLRAPRLGVFLLVLLVLLGLAGGCGDPPRSVEPPAEDTSLPEPARPPTPLEPAPDELSGQLVGVANDLASAWQALHDETPWLRRRGIERLLEADATIAELVRHAARETRWDRDVGLLADLLSRHADEALPALLERTFRTHIVGRRKLMTALGRRRPESGYAAGVLLLRTAASGDADVRKAAVRALAELIPGWELPLRMHHESDGTTLALLAASALAAQPEDARTWTETALWSSFFLALHVEREHYGPDVAYDLSGFLRELPLTNALRAKVALAVAVDGPWSRVASDLLVQAESAGFEATQQLLRERRHLESALGAAPRMGGRATLLIDDILALLRDDVLPFECLAALAAYGARLSDEHQRALYALLEDGFHGPRSADVPSWAWAARAVLQVSRPRGELVGHLQGILDGSSSLGGKERTALQLLAWAHASLREAAATSIRAFADRCEAGPRQTRRQRVLIRRARETLAKPEAWFGPEGRRVIAEGVTREVESDRRRRR